MMIDSDTGGALLRGVHLIALVSVFGTLMFSAAVLRGPPLSWRTYGVEKRLARLLHGSAMFALLSGAAWFVERGAAIAGADTPTALLAALPAVAWDTQFGHLLLVRGALLLAILCHRRASPLALILAGGALGLQAATGHAGATPGAAGQQLMVAEALHVLAAGAWLGALMPLLVTLASVPAQLAVPVLRRFFPLGLITVAIIGATSVVQANQLVGGIPALVGTAYGRMTLAKLALFIVLLCFAAMNRFVFSMRPNAWLRHSIIGEIAFAAVLMLAAGSLAHMTPGRHEQAVWPFAWRINPGPAGAWLIPANPTSYFVSPTGFSVTAIVHGEEAYQAACAGCHGTSAQGDGSLARTLPTIPPDLTARHLLELGDGDLYWRIGHAVNLPEDVRWEVVDYLRARNCGEFVRSAGRGMHVVAMPRFNATCTDGRSLGADDLRGQVLRIIVPDPRQVTSVPQVDAAVTTIALSAGLDAACVAQPEALAALAILLGSTPPELGGTQFLIDPNGWLRGRWRPGEIGGWGAPQLLLARAQALASRPLPLDALTQPHRH